MLTDIICEENLMSQIATESIIDDSSAVPIPVQLNHKDHDTIYLSDGPRIFEHGHSLAAEWVSRLLDEFRLEKPPFIPQPTGSDEGETPLTVNESAPNKPVSCWRRRVSLPSERFLTERPPRIRPNCCLRKRAALTRLSEAKKRRRRYSAGDASAGHKDHNVFRKKKLRRDVIRTRPTELFEVVGQSDPDDRTYSETENDPAPESSTQAPVWISKSTLKFAPCRPHEEGQQFFYITNQTADTIDFSWRVVGDPRLSIQPTDFTVSVPRHVEVLEEKPFFRQTNMKFDPVSYTIGPILGSEKLPFLDSWFQSYRHHRETDNFSSTASVKMSAADFTASVTPNNGDTINGKFQDAVARFFTVEPWFGSLNPLESTLICVRFKPWFLTIAHAQLLCMTTANQPVRSVYLIGPCARVCIDIRPKFLDLGYCMYDAMMERTIRITNSGRYPARFCVGGVTKLTKESLIHPDFGKVYGSVVSGCVKPKEVLKVNIYFIPGKPGRFSKHFYINVRGESAFRIALRGKGVYHSVDVNLPRRLPDAVKKCSEPEIQRRGKARRRPATCSAVIDQKGQVKEGSLVRDALISHWANKAKAQAKRSNIRRNPVFDSTLEFRPFEGILDFAKLPEHLLDFGLHSPAGSVAERQILVVNSGLHPVSFRLSKTNHQLRRKISVNFNRHHIIRPGCSERVHFAIEPYDYALGLSECSVPFTIVNGPTFTVVCKIFVEEPKLNVRVRCVRISGDQDIAPEIFNCKMLMSKPRKGFIDRPLNAHQEPLLLRIPVIDFGTVRCGFQSAIYVQLINPGHVPCSVTSTEVDIDFVRQGKQLSPKRRQELKVERENNRAYHIFPPRCYLPPGHRVNLEITFHPKENSDYNFLWIIEVEYSRQRVVIQARGRGIRPRLEFGSDKLVFDSTIPYMAGHEKSLVIYNPCPFPLEFYCKEPDKQHIYEDEIISRCEEFDRQPEVRFPVRRVGSTIPENIIEWYKRNFAVGPGAGEGHTTGSPQSSDIGGPIDITIPIKSNFLDDDQLSPHLRSRFPKLTLASQMKKKFATKREMYKALREIVLTPLDKAIAHYRGVNMTTDSRKEQFKNGAVFIVHGPPSSGKTTLSTAIAKHYKVPVLTLNKIIMEAIEHPTERIHHRVLNYIQNPVSMGPQASYGPGTARSLQTPPDQQDGKGRDTSKVPSMKMLPKPSKMPSHNKGQPNPLNDPNLQRDRQDPDLAFQAKTISYLNFLTGEPGELTTCVLPEEMLSQLIASRLYRQDCRRGAVFDGLRTDFFDTVLPAARALLIALENRRRIYSFVICNTFRDYRKRRQRQRTQRKNETYAKIIRQMAGVRKLSESEYRTMRRSERKQVDAVIGQYVTYMRILRRRAKMPSFKADVAPLVDHHPLLVTKPTKQAASSQKLSSFNEGVSVDLDKKSHKSDGHNSNDTMGINLNTGVKSLPRGTGSARVSLVKPKGKMTGGAVPGGKHFKMEKIRRDAWEMTPKTRRDGTLSSIYRTDIYRRHKLFYSTLKDYTTIMMKWTGCTREEPKRNMRSDALKDLIPVLTKKRPIKSKEAKNKPKEVADAERAARDKAAIERVKNRCRKRRAFGVKQIMLMRRSTRMTNGGLLNFRNNTGRWKYLPNFQLIDDATKLRIAIPRPEIFAMKKRPPPITPIEDDPTEPRFRFVMGLDETPPRCAVPTPLLTAHHSTHVVPPAIITPERSASPRDREEKSNRLDIKPDRTKTAKSAVKQRNIGSAMPRDIGHPSAKEEKTIAPVDLSQIYPSFNRAKSLSEPKCKPVTYFRWTLPAFNEISLRLLFQSNAEGKFQQTFTFKVVDYGDAEFPVVMRGTCQYTNVLGNLAKIFPPSMWVEQIVDDRLAPVYVEGDGKLYFGPLLAGKNKVDVLADKSPQNIYSFLVKNTYKKTLSVHFNILKHPGSNPKDKTPSADFSVVPDRFQLAPGDEQTVKFYAHPSAIGRCEDTVLAFTEYNPVPTIIILSALSVKPQAELLTKNVVIEKVPIREISFGNIEVRNKSPLIPIHWRLIGIDQLPPEFIFEAREGTLKAVPEVQTIPVRFSSATDKPVIHVKKPLRIEFSAEESDSGPVQTDGFTISGESYDLVLDITFPKVLDSVLDFGICKVNDEVMRQMMIRNKSKSDCGFQLIAVYDDLTDAKYPTEKLTNLLDFQPSSGTLTSADRPITVNVVCKPKFEVELKLERIVRCLVVDPARANMRVAEIPIKTNVCAKYSKFILFPPIGEVRFPTTLPMQKRMRTVTLQNVGDYELTYIMKKISSNSQPAANQPNPTPVQNKKGGQGQDTSGASSHSPGNALVQKVSTASTHISRKADQINVNPGVLAVPFVVRPLTGVVKVGDTAQISVELCSDVIGTHEETHNLEITDRDLSKFLNGIIYTFSGEIAVPTVDVKNIGQIFSEHLVLAADIIVTESALEKWLLDRSVYVPKRRQFFVQHTFVGAKRRLRFKLTNPTNIQCPVVISLRPPLMTAGKSAAKPTVEGFSIAASPSVVIEPHQFIHVVVIFAPSLAIKYQATFDLVIETQAAPPTRTSGMNFEIFAEAVLPNLRILPPVQKDRRGQLCLYYQKTALGRSQPLPVRILNDTVMPITAHLRLRNAEHVFEIVPVDIDDSKMARLVRFNPKEERVIDLKFSPTLTGRFRKYLEIACAENACPDIFIQLRGESVAEDVELCGLPEVTYGDRLRLTTATANQVEDVVMERYQLFFGDCKPGQNLSAKFEIVNPTENWQRFEWLKLPDTVEITPRAGHIKPQSFAEVQTKYTSAEDLQTQILPIQCTFSTITVLETYDMDNIWNSDKQSLQILSDIRKARPESDSLSAPHLTDKLEVDRDSEHSVRDGGKHEKKDFGKKPVETKKQKEKKPVGKKDSLTDKHRKTTDKVEKTKRKQSDQKTEVKIGDDHGKISGEIASTHKEASSSRPPGDITKTAESPRSSPSPSMVKTEGSTGEEQAAQLKIMAPMPEPAFTVKTGTTRNMTLVISSIVGYAKYECSVQEILFKDTFILERRKVTFTVKNTGSVALRYKAALSISANACVAYLQQVAPVSATRVLSAQEKEKPERTRRGKVEAPVDDEAVTPVATATTVRSEKPSKHAGSPRTPAAPSTTDVPAPKESQKRKRKISRDSADAPTVQQQSVPSPLTTGQTKKEPPAPMTAINTRRIDVGRFRSFTALQTAGLTTAFEVMPADGVIYPQNSQIFTVEFRPGETMEYLGCLFFQLENPDPRGLPLVVPIHGLAKLPLLHLNTTTEANLRWNEGHSADGRILDFKCIGTDETMTQQLILTNPTSTDYQFSMTCLDNEDSRKPPFEVSKLTGSVAGGKRSQVDILFIPYCLGLMESKWLLQLPSQGVVFPLSFNALVRDPDVSLTPAVVAFRPLLPKMKRTKAVVMTNNENIDLKFVMDMENFKGYEGISWDVNPSQGIIKAKSKREIFITVSPCKEFTADLVLLCNIQKCSQPLRVLLEHEVAAPSIEIVYLNDNDRITLLDDSNNQSNIIDFGHTDACSVYKKNFQFTNTGSINVSYTVKVVTCTSNSHAYEPVEKPCLQLSSRQGILTPGKILMLILTYTPRSLKDKLTHLSLLVEIEFGPRYLLNLTGDLFNIDIDFSFDECDFGPTLVLRDSPEIGSTVPLIIENRTRRKIALDLVNYVLPPSMAFEFSALTLEPGNSTIHTVMFLPTDVGPCSGSLTFLMNESITKTITLKGEGVEMHVEVPARMRYLQFHSCAVGKRSTVLVEVRNRSKVEIIGRVMLQNRTASSALKALLDDGILGVSPDKDTIIPANQVFIATLDFKPVARTLSFEARVCFVTHQQVVRELSNLTGNCDGLDVVLQEKMIDFGALVLHGSLRRSIVMKSLGELGAYYSWDYGRAGPHFSIKHRKGYVPAKGEVVFEVTFAPKVLDTDIRVKDITCNIPGNRTAIHLTLVGSCVPLPVPKDVIMFECPVRQADAKPLVISNTTSTSWQLKPVVNSDRWTVPSVITVKPNGTETFEAVFRPLEGRIHQATVSVVLPTGQAVVYNLHGKTQPPKPNGKIVRDIPCRTEHRETMILANWLPRMQAFRVIYGYVKPDKSDASIELSGKTIVHIPALAQMEYQFTFKALRDKDVNAVYIYRIVFKNEETGEYQYYDVQYKVIKGPSFDSKTIASQVRTMRRETIKVLNPLETQATITCTLQGSSGDITLEPATSMVIGGRKEAEIHVDYFPLKPGSATARVDVTSPELGSFFIELNLQASAGTHEPPIHFECVLGSTTTQTCRVLNYTKAKADFVVKVVEGTSEFQLVSDRAAYSVQPGSILSPSELAIDVQFDPSQLGEFRGRVVATSQTAGEFNFTFIGKCIRPKPRGHFVFTANGETIPALEFKNPFLHPCTFTLVSSSRVFQVKESTDVVKAKKTIILPVTFAPTNIDSVLLRNASVMGQITITPKQDGTFAEEENAEWVYYVKADS